MINYHSVAYEIENIAKSVLAGNEKREAFYDADAIETGSYFEVILYVLRTKLGFQESLVEYSSKYAPYLGVAMKKIPENVIIEIKQEFIERLGERK